MISMYTIQKYIRNVINEKDYPDISSRQGVKQRIVIKKYFKLPNNFWKLD